MIAQKIHRFFTISDFEQEEDFLREQHQNGLELASYSGLTCYHFKRCEPKDVVYRLDYCGANHENKEVYIQMFRDYGWEYLFDRFGWSYFRKEVGEDGVAEEIFCDDESRLQMMNRVIKGRMIPLLVLFFAILLPQFVLNLTIYNNYVSAAVSGAILSVYVTVFATVFVKYNQFRNKVK